MTNNVLVDQAGSIREGEELDLDCLRQYLEPVLGSAVATLEVKQFPGGFSNLTYLLSSGDDKWVLRRPPFGSTVKSAHDMSRKFIPTDQCPFISVRIKKSLAAISI